MSEDVDKRRKDREVLKSKYSQLFEAISAILFRCDPVGINFEINTDEYELEVGTILPRLRAAQSESDISRIVAEELSRWFGGNWLGHGSLKEIAHEIWQLRSQF